MRRTHLSRGALAVVCTGTLVLGGNALAATGMSDAPTAGSAVNPEIPAGVLAASAAPGSSWTPGPAIYGTNSQNDVPVRAKDGTVLRVNVIYPTDPKTGAAAKGPFPVLLTQTPYGKGQGSHSAPGSAAAPGGASATGGADDYLVERGYIEVVADVRGTGDSGGSWGPFDPVQTTDGITLVNWAAELPHANGKVGTYGPSYLAINQMLLAGRIGTNSPLKAIFPVVSANDIYRDTTFMGACSTLSSTWRTSA